MKHQSNLNVYVRKSGNSCLQKEKTFKKLRLWSPIFSCNISSQSDCFKICHCKDKNISDFKHHQGTLLPVTPFTLVTNRSKDTGLPKMNPVTIRSFHMKNSKKVTNNFYDICTTTSEDCCKGMICLMPFIEDSVPWSNAVRLSIDMQ